MERGAITFAVLFLLLPVLLFAGAWILTSAWGVLLAIVALTLLFIGFTLVVSATSW